MLRRSCSKWTSNRWRRRRAPAHARRSGRGRPPAASGGDAMKTLLIGAKVLLGLGVAAMLGACGGGGGSGSDPFNFRADAADRFVRIDRMGEPALATALLSKNVNDPIPVDGSGNPVNPGSGNKFNNFNDQRDAFNRGDPVNDARDFAFILTVGPQINSLAN